MTTYSFSAQVGLTPSSQTFELVQNTRVFRSSLTNAVQTSGRKGAFWRTTATFSNLQDADKGKVQGFLAKLNGQEHRLEFSDYGYDRQGTAPSSNSLVVNGNDQLGSTHNADGATANKTGYLKAGDYIEVNNALHIVTSDCNSNGSGQVAIPIAPPLRSSPTNNAPIEFVAPKSVMMLVSEPKWTTQPGLIASFTIDAVEDVLA
jgi:hypothetical protein